MKIRMKTQASGPDTQLKAGQVYDLPDDFAAALFEGGYAEIIAVSEEKKTEEQALAGENETQVETAALSGPTETAEGHGNRRGKRKGGK